jgi:CBS domain-containing protein
MTAPLLTLESRMPVSEARARMEAAGLDEAAVVEGDRTLVGLLTRRALAGAAGKNGVTAGAVAMATLSVESEETLDTALGLLAQHGVHRLPVVDVDAPACLAGIVTTEGIARAYARHAGGDVRRLGALAPGTALREVTLAPGARAVGQAVRELSLPPQALIIAVQRAGGTLIPRGSTVLQAGDVLTIMATTEAMPGIESAVQG